MFWDVPILAGLVACGLWTVMARDLLRAAIALGLASALLSIAMVRLGAPLAAVFELSVCAGLVTVVFIAAVALTRPASPAETRDEAPRRLGRYWPLPLLLALVALAVAPLAIPEDSAAVAMVDVEPGALLWTERATDVLGQMLVVLAGVFGVAVLFRRDAEVRA